jgi:PAS domain S-box-containing protein
MDAQPVETDLRSLLHNATGFAVYRLAVDPDHPFGARVSMVSPSLTEMIGATDLDRFETWFQNLHPDDRDRVVAANRRALEQGEPYDEVTRVYHPGKGDWVWVRTLSTPIFDDHGTLTHFNGLVIDVSEQKQAQEALQRRSAFENLITAISTRFINLAFDQIDDGIAQALQEIGEFTAVDRSYVFLFSADRARFGCTHEWNAPGIQPQIDGLQALSVQEWAWSNERILDGQVLHIPHVDRLPGEASVERQAFTQQGIRSLLAVPMVYQGDVLGFLGFDAVRGQKTWSEQDIVLLQIVGEIFVNALEHKLAQEALQEAYQSLERRVQARTCEIQRRQEIAESLRDIVAAINASLPLQDILERIVRQAATHLNAAACVLSRFDFDNEQFRHEATYGWPAALGEQAVIPFSLKREIGSEGYLRTVTERIPVYGNYSPLPDRLDEIRHDPSIPDEIKARRLIIRTRFAGSMTVPLVVADQSYGGLAFYYAEPQPFSEEQVQLALTFAEQAALALENAQLRQQVAQSAVAAERSRLARDLHDAVTQTLFSASLIAEVLPRIWEHDPDEGRRRLAELRELTRGALAEMRTLLLELRPSALLETCLSDLLKQLCESITGRARVPVSLDVEGECQAPVEVRVAFYRIAQEALNNVAKHAGASAASVRLCCTPEETALSVRDDGRGFDPAAISPDHLGLGIMRERAEAVDAVLKIDSQTGQGTSIHIRWRNPLPESAKKEP